MMISNKPGKTPKKLRTLSKRLDKQSAKHVLWNLVAKPQNGSRPYLARLLSREVQSTKDVFSERLYSFI